jgi:hypothetical protein
MSQQINFDLPSPETLAGIYICVEGEEDVTVHPRQIQPIKVSSDPENGARHDAGHTATNPAEAKPPK